MRQHKRIPQTNGRISVSNFVLFRWSVISAALVLFGLVIFTWFAPTPFHFYFWNRQNTFYIHDSYQTASEIRSTVAKSNSDVLNASVYVSEQVFCKFPHLLVDDPSLAPYIKHHKPLECSSMKNWVYTSDGKFHISKAAKEKYENISCLYYDVYRIDDNRWDWKAYPIGDGAELLGDVFRVTCNATKKNWQRPTDKEHSGYYDNVHAGVKYRPEYHNRTADQIAKPLNMNVYMYLLDSMSRINFIRKLPKFYKFLTEEMKGVVMKGYNIVGDGTPWALIPMTTGHFQTELYEARKRFKNSSMLDEWPFIFKAFKKAGFVTSYADEMPAYSAFNYKLRGFKDPPVDHYLRTFVQTVNHVRNNHKPYCFGDTPRSITLCNWWKEQQLMYRASGVNTFSLMFTSETSHDDYNLVQVLDEHLENVFRSQFQDGLFNDTFLVIMGDHGRRFGPVRQTQSGKLEEKLPFLIVVPPPSFSTEYSVASRNLEINSNRLVTVFDLHETLKELTNFTGESPEMAPRSQRGISLFQEISPERTCADAWIKPHFCSCLNWESVNESQFEVQQGVDFVLTQFNSILLGANGQCRKLALQKIVSVSKLKPNKELMSFKESRDYDNYFPDLSANANVSYVLYNVRFVTDPNNGEYEVSMTRFYDVPDLNWTMSMSDVSRLNMYGDQPACIMQTHPHLREYCLCSHSKDVKL